MPDDARAPTSTHWRARLDLAYFDGLRFVDGIGPIPEAFFDGYGRRPVGPWYELHRAGIAATVIDVVARGYASLAWDLPRAERVLTTGGQGT